MEVIFMIIIFIVMIILKIISLQKYFKNDNCVINIDEANDFWGEGVFSEKE